VNWARTQPVTRWLAEAGKKLSKKVVEAHQLAFTARLESSMAGADAWLTPTVPVLPPRVGAWKHLPPEEHFRAAAQLGMFTALFNLLGYPAASLPAGLAGDGLPIGVQIATRAGDEARLLGLSRLVEEAMPWIGRRAPLA
jgi:amidase